MNDITHTIDAITKFRDARDWKKFHTPENLAKSISIEAAELLELFQWGDNYNSDDLKDELADVLIYSFLLADAIDENPLDLIEKKLRLNEKRFPVDKVKGNSGKDAKVVIE